MHPPPFPDIKLTSYHYAAVMHWLRSHLPLYNGAAVKILWEIADRTFGHRKWEDVVSLSQFATACGIGRDTVLVVLAELLDVGILRRRNVGNSYAYHLNIPNDLFSRPSEPQAQDDPIVDNGDVVIHNKRAECSFFAQNQGASPQTGRMGADLFSSQIQNVTGGRNGWHRFVEILTTIQSLNDTLPRTAYALRNLSRWAQRAVALGMQWGDVWSLWQACCRVGKRPVALFLHRLTHDGTLPTGKPRQVRDATKCMFAQMLE